MIVSGASLASYLLSQWSFIRSGGAGWLAVGVATIFLVAAAAIVVLTTSTFSALRAWSSDPSDRTIKPASIDGEFSVPDLNPEEAAAGQANAGSPAGTSKDRSGSTLGQAAASNNQQRGNETGTTQAAQDSPPVTAVSADSGNFRTSRDARSVFIPAGPWGATDCVIALSRPATGNLPRWIIDNGCGVPVGVVIASCSEESRQCDEPGSTLWEYRVGGMLLPAKAQRPVTELEDTQYGQEIRFAACAVSAPVAIKQIGQDGEEGSPQLLEAAGNGDECLLRVRYWTDVGRSTGKVVSALLDVNAKQRP